MALASDDDRPLNRKQLAQFLPNHAAIRAFEKTLDAINNILPADLAATSVLLGETKGEALLALAQANAALALIQALSANGDRGDITVSQNGLTFTIDNDAVTFAKLQNVDTNTLIGRATAGTGDPESILLGANLSLTGNTLNAATAGPRGSDGASGLNGEVGEDGRDSFIPGPQGNAGAPGANGLDGISIRGEDGADGQDGVPGPQGATGPTGANGTNGANGLDAFTIRGDDGLDGVDGMPGQQGVQGIQGTTGSQGLQGFDGLTIRGNDGDDGADGVPGVQGIQGPQGAQGLAGADGLTMFVMTGQDGEDGRDSYIPGPQGPAGSGGAAAWTEVEIDFGTAPVYDARFTITDAAITSSAVKVILVPSGKAAIGRTADDWQWDGGTFAANPGAGSATCYATFSPGPIVGKRKLQYQVA